MGCFETFVLSRLCTYSEVFLGGEQKYLSLIARFTKERQVPACEVNI